MRLHLINPVFVTAVCAVMATLLGLAYLAAAGAPAQYLAINGAALVAGLIVAGTLFLLGRSGVQPGGIVVFGLGACLVATALFGLSADGVTRWASVAGFSIQPSLVLLPAMVVIHARAPGLASTAGLVLAALALALQPDRAMAGALLAGLGALTLFRVERQTLAALASAGAGFAITLFRQDSLPASPYVDQIFYSAFSVHPLAGMAVIGGAILLLVPAIAGLLTGSSARPAWAAFGGLWLAVILAAAVGNYPTPLVGYGGSAILGYVICLSALPSTGRSSRVARQASKDATESLAHPEPDRFAAA